MAQYKSVSLDDLLAINKQQFDKIISHQQEHLDAVGVRKSTPITSSGLITSPGPTPALSNTNSKPKATADRPAKSAVTTPVTIAATIKPHGEPVAATQQKTGQLALNLLEHALRSTCAEMNATLLRKAKSPFIRYHHEQYALLADAEGRLLAGQFAADIVDLLESAKISPQAGDVILQSDPYHCQGAVNQINNWLVLIPVFSADELLGFSAMSAHMLDVGGPVAGSTPAAASSIFAEGLRIPPVKLYQQGKLNQAVLAVIMGNTREPDINHSDLQAIISACRVGEQRLQELQHRFGAANYQQVCQGLLQRSHQVMREIILQQLPEEPQAFEDYVDDDGCGNGPFRLKLTLWREGEQAYFDWTGTSPQAQGPINSYLHPGLFKLFIGNYLLQRLDPEFTCNSGFNDLIHVTMPQRSLIQPEFPAALGQHSQTLVRQFEVLEATLNKTTPETASAAAYGSRPYLVYTGTGVDNQVFRLFEILPGGMPGHPAGDGLDGHSWWPELETIPTEHLEKHYPVIIEKNACISDSGGAGCHRGGNGIEKIYRFLQAGEISIHDDRQQTQPWGVLGGQPGACSEKYLESNAGERRALPAKADHITVQAGERLIFRTAGGGGWGDPLSRTLQNVRDDIARKLISADHARNAYGVVLNAAGAVDTIASRDLRASMHRNRDVLPTFDFGQQLSATIKEQKT